MKDLAIKHRAATQAREHTPVPDAFLALLLLQLAGTTRKNENGTGKAPCPFSKYQLSLLLVFVLSCRRCEVLPPSSPDQRKRAVLACACQPTPIHEPMRSNISECQTMQDSAQ
jgi:hypothetical protein